MRLIQGQDWGAQIINDCSAFQGYKMKELAKKLRTKDAKDVLKQITGEDISVSVDGNTLKYEDNFEEKKGSGITGKTLLQ